MSTSVSNQIKQFVLAENFQTLIGRCDAGLPSQEPPWLVPRYIECRFINEDLNITVRQWNFRMNDRLVRLKRGSL